MGDLPYTNIDVEAVANRVATFSKILPDRVENVNGRKCIMETAGSIARVPCCRGVNVFAPLPPQKKLQRM